MPNRRKYNFTETDKKGRPHKEKLVEELRQCVDDYDTVYVFRTDNMRNSHLKDLRQEWKADSRFIFGKQSVMQIALGKNDVDEYQDNLHVLSKQLTGQCGLLFTNKPEREVRDFFATYAVPEFARSGFVPTETMILPAGPLEQLSFSIEPYLRNFLGMNTSLQRGVVTLREDFEMCTKGKPLTHAQSQILKFLGRQITEFRLHLKCLWRKKGAKVKKLKLKSSAEENMATRQSNVIAKVPRITKVKNDAELRRQKLKLNSDENEVNGEDNFSLRMDAD